MTETMTSKIYFVKIHIGSEHWYESDESMILYILLKTKTEFHKYNPVLLVLRRIYHDL